MKWWLDFIETSHWQSYPPKKNPQDLYFFLMKCLKQKTILCNNNSIDINQYNFFFFSKYKIHLKK